MIDDAAARTRRALLAGLGAYGLWGLVPLFFKLLGAVGAGEIIAHRVVWSVLFLLAVLLLRHGRGFFRHVRITPRVAAALLVSGALVAFNWLVFVYAINTDRVLSTSLGYYINPLVSVLLGTIVLGERMIGAQVLAVLLAAAGTLWLTVASGQPPWLSLALAFSFGLYGLVRKLTDVGPMVGLFWETLMMMPVALAWLVWTGQSGDSAFGDSVSISLLLAASGLVTVVPLVLFATAARGLPLVTVGLMQYIAPSISFCLAVFLFRETFTFDHGVAFVCIWTALALYSWAGWQRTRQLRRLARAQAAH
ncbi:MAG: EamA family transporter RarD [Wenzhouxiangellaceae bacterium]|nr:EamA family transporter RarD [Wenzhouxiangellaceae bacterium]